MFILIPLVILFFCFTYLKVNNNISLVSYIIVYVIIIITITFSFYIYKKLKQDAKQQDINTLKQEINELIFRIKKEDNEEKIKLLEKRIYKIQGEIDDKL